MRARLLAVAVGTATALLVAGCANPAGVDGNLTNNWSAMPDAKVPVPANLACYGVAEIAVGGKLPAPVDCGAAHTLETVHVGAFTGEDAARDTPPVDGGPGQRKAYEECATQVREFLGDDWRTGRLILHLAVPNAGQWGAEARWFRCDLIEVKDLDALYGMVFRSASLKGALAGDRPLRLGCFKVTVRAEQIDTESAVDCATPHNAEFVGIYEAPPGNHPADPNATNFHDACWDVIASYTGIRDGSIKFRTSVFYRYFTKKDWDLGNRGVRCYLWTDDKPVTRSLKGAGPGALPMS